MTTRTQQPQGQNGVLSSLNMAIDALNLAKEATGVAPAKTAFSSASVLLTMIRDSMANKVEYVELGLTCADICEALNPGMDRKQADQPSLSVLGAIERLTRTTSEIQRHIIERGKRNVISRRYHAKDDKAAIATWRLDLNGIFHVFNTELGIDTRATGSDAHQDAANKSAIIPNFHRDTSDAKAIVPGVRRDVENSPTVVSDIHHNKLKSREGVDGRNQPAHASAPGESPPPPQRNTHGISSDIHRDVVKTQTVVNDIRDMLKSQEGADGQHPSVSNFNYRETQRLMFASSVPGELPPPPPRAFFGRDDLIEKIVRFARGLTPIALIGAGGIGKTSAVLAVLHDDRIKQHFGHNRRFIRCDQFPASHTHLLHRISKVIGADIENLEDLTPLRQYLSSKEMIIVLDNAESIFDPQGSSAQEIYTVVDELTRFSNICLCITSRISTIPPHCETLHIPTLSMEAGCDTFYRIYKHGERTDAINDILKQLDFHPLSITLLATVAQHNTWDTNRLSKEWGRQRTGVLRAQHSGSLAATIELSLASPMFRELGPDARELLGVVAFFPQGINEENADWLFPDISDGPNVFDKFCILSLTYRTNGFVTMLAPIRDYLRPKDPMSSLLLDATKERYFSQLSVRIHPEEPGFEDSRWITSEDVNVEHLLDVFTSIDASSENVWDACAVFMVHLYWHKPRLVMLGPKIESLPDDHPSKAQCLDDLSRLFYSLGNWVERKRLLTYTIKLWREQGDDYQVACKLNSLAGTNRRIGLHKEGIKLAKEASEIFEKLGYTTKQAECLITLAYTLCDDEQLDAAEEAAFRAIDLLPEKGEQFQVSTAYRILGEIYESKGDTEKAIRHSEVALGVASSLNQDYQLFLAHFNLAQLFFGEGRFSDAQAHIEHAKSHAINDPYRLGRGMELQAGFWYQQCMFEKARLEVSHAADIYEKLGAVQDLGRCREFIQQIDEQMNNPVVSDEPDANGREAE